MKGCGSIKRILLACGTGVVTSTLATSRLNDAMKERGLEGTYTLGQCKVAELVSMMEGYDIIVSTTQAPANLTKPFINGLPILTGVGVEKVWDELEKFLKE